jgi:hypothetical protein
LRSSHGVHCPTQLLSLVPSQLNCDASLRLTPFSCAWLSLSPSVSSLLRIYVHVCAYIACIYRNYCFLIIKQTKILCGQLVHLTSTILDKTSPRSLSGISFNSTPNQAGRATKISQSLLSHWNSPFLHMPTIQHMCTCMWFVVYMHVCILVHVHACT